MSSRPKRARSSTTNEDVNVDAQANTDGSSKPRPHDALWFEDGNIVLATDVHLYCVHRGVLAKNSSVFRDMLELSNVAGVSGGVNGESWEGKPLVKMVGDSDENVSHLLMALYDIEFYSAYKPTTLPVIISLLLMSTKYDIPAMRNEVTNHLARVYPSNLDCMPGRTLNDLFVDHKSTPDDYEFQLLAIAQRCNVKILLPMLYFECALQSLEFILESCIRNQIRDQLTLVLGHEDLSKLSFEFGVKAFAPQKACISSRCSRSRTKMFMKYMDFDSYDIPTFPVAALLERGTAVGNEELRASVCSECSEKSVTSLEDFRSEVWENMPEIFDLGTWDDVKSG